MRYPLPCAVAALVILSACLPATPPPTEDSCGAVDLQNLVGQPLDRQAFDGIGAAQRIMPDGSAMTMDYRADRLNVTYDGQNRITRIWCS